MGHDPLEASGYSRDNRQVPIGVLSCCTNEWVEEPERVLDSICEHIDVWLAENGVLSLSMVFNEVGFDLEECPFWSC